MVIWTYDWGEVSSCSPSCWDTGLASCIQGTDPGWSAALWLSLLLSEHWTLNLQFLAMWDEEKQHLKHVLLLWGMFWIPKWASLWKPNTYAEGVVFYAVDTIYHHHLILLWAHLCQMWLWDTSVSLFLIRHSVLLLVWCPNCCPLLLEMKQEFLYHGNDTSCCVEEREARQVPFSFFWLKFH